jgi:predicted secreted Zn-dependent protease
MRAWRRGLLVLASCWAIVAWVGSGSLRAEPTYSETIVPYTVTGRTIPEILDSIARNGSKLGGHAGGTTVGRTLPKFGWSWKLEAAPEGCRVTSVHVSLAVTIRMPRWQDRDTAPATLRAEWDRYYADVLQHERRHAEISRAAARTIERAILALPPRPTCAQLRGEIRPVVEAIVRAHDARQAAFDVKEGSCNIRRSCLGKAGVSTR